MIFLNLQRRARIFKVLDKFELISKQSGAAINFNGSSKVYFSATVCGMVKTAVCIIYIYIYIYTCIFIYLYYFL
jgi:hypothetical protein